MFPPRNPESVLGYPILPRRMTGGDFFLPTGSGAIGLSCDADQSLLPRELTGLARRESTASPHKLTGNT